MYIIVSCFLDELIPIYSLAYKFVPTALINSNPQSIHVKMHCCEQSSRNPSTDL